MKIKIMLSIIFTFLVLLITCLAIRRNRVLTLEPPSSSLLYPETLKWGIYKPYLVFGVTERKSDPLTLRFAFTNRPASSVISTVREWKGKIFYEFHNGVSFASEILEMRDEYDFSVNWIKEYNNDQFQAWRTIVDFRKNIGKPMSLFFSFSSESWVRAENSKFLRINNGAIEIFEDQKFSSLLNPRVLNCSDSSLKFYGVNSASNKYFQNINDNFQKALLDFMPQATEGKFYSGIIMKVELTPDVSSIVDIAFSDFSSALSPSLIPEMPNLSASQIVEKIKRRKENFEKKFSLAFESGEYQKCSQISLSTLLGGLIYENGPIFYRETDTYQDPKELFSATPCRTEFPRGFLWDEGFHQSIICHFSPAICMSSLKSWFETTWEDGWIPREQIRGDETEEYANRNFLSQTKDEANPPTLMFPISILAREMKRGDKIVLNFFSSVYPKIKKWFFWFHDSAETEKGSNLFKWKERQPGLYLGSGLDDYPRGNSKYHLDLQCWVAFFAQQLLGLANQFDSEEEADRIKGIYEKVKEKLFDVFLDDDGLMKDVTHEGFSPHIGYITILPLALGFLKENSHAFNSTLVAIANPSKLWSDFGIRSLSKEDKFFGKGENYWRGRIWIPFNYLLLRGLKLYYCQNEQAMRIYNELRNNLLNNVCKRFDETKFFFENYESESGKGSYNHPFNGWTSLITLIASEKYA